MKKIIFPFLLNTVFSLPPEFSFAEIFFQEQEYYRSATEYQRLAFTYKNSRFSVFAHLRAAESFYLGKQFSLCLKEIELVKNQIPYENHFLFLKTFCAANLENYSLALQEVEKWPMPFRLHQKTLYQTLQNHPLIFQKDGWLKEYKENLPPGLSYPIADVNYFSSLENFPPKKSPLLASFLSTLLPGLGQIYYGSWGDGITSFFTVGSLSLLGYIAFEQKEKGLASVSFAGATLFYLSGIYGAYYNTERHNSELQREFKERILQLSFRYQVASFP